MNTGTAFEILGLNHSTTSREIEERYRTLATDRHPDRGGTNESMAELNEARAVALVSLIDSGALVPIDKVWPALDLVANRQDKQRIVAQRIAKTEEQLLFRSTNKLHRYKRTAGIFAAIFVAVLFFGQNFPKDILIPQVTESEVTERTQQMATIARDMEKEARKAIYGLATESLPAEVAALPPPRSPELITAIATGLAQGMAAALRTGFPPEIGGLATNLATKMTAVWAERITELEPHRGPGRAPGTTPPWIQSWAHNWAHNWATRITPKIPAEIGLRDAMNLIESIRSNGANAGLAELRVRLEATRTAKGSELTRLLSITSFVIAALSGFAYWVFTSRIERVENKLGDLEQHTATKTLLFHLLHEILVDRIRDSWTLSQMADVVSQWASEPGPYRNAAQTIGPLNFSQLLLDRAQHLNLVSVREDFVSGQLVEYYTIIAYTDGDV